MNVKLSQEEIIKIKQLHRSCKHRKHADKLKAILLLDKGHSCIEVGEILLLDDATIRTYRNTYLSQGTQSLLKDNNKGTTTFLSSEQLETLEKHLTAKVYTDSKGIVVWIETKFGIRYSSSGINALLNRLGFVYKKPVLTPCKANVEKQEEFVKQYASEKFRNILKSYKGLVLQSMSRKGNCWDNAVAESFFKSLKAEWVYKHNYQLRSQAELSIFQWIETWYNKNRRHSYLDYKTINEFELNIYKQKLAA